MNIVWFLFSLVLPIGFTLLLSSRTLWLAFADPKSLEWQDFPEYDKLSETMSVRLSPNRRWGVGRIAGIARANPLQKQVLLHSKFFFRFTPEERLAIVAHELAHIKSRHSLFSTLILTVGLALSFFAAIGTSLLILPSIVWLVFFLVMVLYRRSAEYQADSIACRYIECGLLVSALSRIGVGKGSDRIVQGLSHPPLKERVRKLKQQEVSR